MTRQILIIGAITVLAACATKRPAATPAPPPQPLPATGPLARGPDAAPAPSLASVAPRTESAQPPGVLPAQLPAGTLYVCTTAVGGTLRHAAIEYAPNVRDLCAKHPEMGVCQYEREACRASGGRVYDAKGTEITKQIEAEYDRKVMRMRFRAG